MPIPNFSVLLEQIADGQRDAFDKLYQYSASAFSVNDIRLLQEKMRQIGEEHRAYSFRLALTALQYHKGIGKPVNHQLAFQYYQKAVGLNNPCAMYCSAVMYQKSHGVDANLEKAIGLLEQAIEFDHVPSMCLRASIYFRIEKKYEEAIELYEQAIKFENVRALFDLAFLYEQDDFTGKNTDLAKQYYMRAIALDHAPSMNRLAWIYINDEHNYEEAFRLFNKAIRKESPTAMNSLASMYEKAFDVYNKKVKPGADRPESINNLKFTQLGEPDRYLPRAWILYYKAWILYYKAYCKSKDSRDVKMLSCGVEMLKVLSKKIPDKEECWSIFLETLSNNKDTQSYKDKETLDPRIYLLEKLDIGSCLKNLQTQNDKQQQSAIAAAMFDVFASSKQSKSQQNQIKNYLDRLALEQKLEASPVSPVFSETCGVSWPRFFRLRGGDDEVQIEDYAVTFEQG